MSYFLSQPGLDRVDRWRRRVTWRSFGAAVKRSVNEVAASGFQPDIIIGVNSGIVPASIIALNLRTPELYFYEALPLYDKGIRIQSLFRDKSAVSFDNKKILVVDDQSYTGRSLETMVNFLAQKGVNRDNIQTHVLYQYRGGAGVVVSDIPPVHFVQGDVKRMPWVILDTMRGYWRARDRQQRPSGD